jgi:hypothetical protein
MHQQIFLNSEGQEKDEEIKDASQAYITAEDDQT